VQRAGIKVTEKNGIPKLEKDDHEKAFQICGGCTLIFDLDTLSLRYAITKPLLDVEAVQQNVHQLDEARCLEIFKYQHEMDIEQSQFQAYFGQGKINAFNEPFNFLHTH
jgi:hypothetical protein